MSPRFRAKYRKWKGNWSPKVLPLRRSFTNYFEALVIFGYDSFLSPILFVFASALLFEQVYPLLTNWIDWDTFVSLLEKDMLMNYIPYIFFAVVLFLWFFGFLFKQSKEDEKTRADEEWRKADNEWKKSVLDTLRQIGEHLDSLETGERNEDKGKPKQ